MEDNEGQVTLYITPENFGDFLTSEAINLNEWVVKATRQIQEDNRGGGEAALIGNYLERADEALRGVGETPDVTVMPRRLYQNEKENPWIKTHPGTYTTVRSPEVVGRDAYSIGTYVIGEQLFVYQEEEPSEMTGGERDLRGRAVQDFEEKLARRRKHNLPTSIKPRKQIIRTMISRNEYLIGQSDLTRGPRKDQLAVTRIKVPRQPDTSSRASSGYRGGLIDQRAYASMSPNLAIEFNGALDRATHNMRMLRDASERLTSLGWDLSDMSEAEE
jgi:hypothetical protein